MGSEACTDAWDGVGALNEFFVLFFSFSFFLLPLDINFFHFCLEY